tara:strand:+ start:1243 stop:2160 length:918 start_codon:yes stop_codon:yes gene_type:complete
MFLKKYPTFIGYCALIFWALSAPFVVKIKHLPVFETLSVVFSVSFIFSATKLTLCKQWSTLKQPWILGFVGLIGIYGNDILYITAFQHAPAAHADLINYLWPIMVILFTGFLPNENLTLRHILAAASGFAGVYVLIHNQNDGFNPDYILGYFLAFMDAVVWSLYTLVARHYGKSPVEMIGVYCGIGAIISIIVHLQTETFLLPSIEQWCILVSMGLCTQCLAYFFWDFGIKKGNFKMLTILAYANPVLSVFFLILFGMADTSHELFIACVLVTIGGIIGMIPWQKALHFFYGTVQLMPSKPPKEQ